MKAHQILEDGKIVKGVNTTPDVKTGETARQAAKFDNKIGKDGPPLLHSKAKKNANPHVLDNLGLAEANIKKPHPKDTLGVKRHEMPQVHAKHYPELFRYLADHGAAMAKGEVKATDLKAVQSEFSDQGIEKMMRKGGITGDGTKKPLLVSSDSYIIDGHHRWLASYNNGETVPIIRFSIPVKQLLDLVREFPHTTYKDIYNEEEMQNEEKTRNRRSYSNRRSNECGSSR